MCTVTELKSALLMGETEFQQKYDSLKPRRDDTNIVFYGLSAVKSGAAVQIAHQLGFKGLTTHSLLVLMLLGQFGENWSLNC